MWPSLYEFELSMHVPVDEEWGKKFFHAQRKMVTMVDDELQNARSVGGKIPPETVGYDKRRWD